MAIDDVISDYEISISASATTSIQPASGDEWLVTWIGVANASVGDGKLRAQTSDEEFGTALLGSTTQVLASDVGYSGAMPGIKFFVSNSDYIRLTNKGSGTIIGAFSAIKTKD
jgi:hypothetical protein